MSQLKNSLLAGLAFGLFFGLYMAMRVDMQVALIAGSVSGLAFGIAIYFFVNSKTVKKQTQLEHQDDTKIIHSAGANHFLNGEAVGGKLYLLADKLQFQSHRFNIQNHALTVAIKEIKEVDFYNNLGLVPNGLAITTVDGRTEKFVLGNRKLWKEEIEKLRRKLNFL